MRPMFFITGAAGGLGKAFASECASRGWDLFLTDISLPALGTIAEGLTNTYGVRVLYFPCDLTDAPSRRDLYEHIKSGRFCFSGLINVAGLDFEGSFLDRTPDQIHTLIGVNVEANLEITRQLIEYRDKSAIFRIINVASLAAFYPMPLKGMYSASKRFLLNFSMALREELRSMNCSVTVLCPAGMPTNEACIRSIDAQGFAGMITTKNVGYVASITLDKALKGRMICIPGLLNKILRFLGGLVPQTLVAYLIRLRWSTARAKNELSQRNDLAKKELNRTQLLGKGTVQG